MNAAQFLELLVSLSLQAAVLVLLTSVACRVAQSPAVQCRLWNLCYVLLLGLTAAALLLPHVRLVRPWPVVSDHAVERLASLESTIGSVALAIWAAGATCSLIVLIWQWTKAVRFLRTCRPAGTAINQHLFETMGDVSPTVLLSTEIASPFCCQWHQAYLVLPDFLRDESAETIQTVVRHEIEHLRCGHPLHLFLQRVVETLFWFHPLIHRASRQMALAREYACDDAAVSTPGDVVTYLKMLVAIAERGQVREREGALHFFGRSASIVALRGRRLVQQLELGRPTCGNRRQLATHSLVLAASVLCFLVWAPCDVLASARTIWSPWPEWSAEVLRSFEIPARDFEPFERRTRLYELNDDSPSDAPHL